jgi:FkbM family methyltransferase
MRRELLKAADSLGIRPGLARARDGLVAALTGGNANALHRRNHLDDAHLKLLLSFLLAPESSCLDVGAHKGIFLTHFVRLAPRGHHIAYEPLPHLAAELAERFPSIEVRRAALSDHEGESTFVHVKDQPAYSGLRRGTSTDGHDTESIDVTTERLDDHVPPGWLPTFVKIDVEGAEGLVLSGAMDTLRRARPVLAFEHGWGGGEAHGVTDDDMYRMVCGDIGLRLFDLDGGGPLDRSQFRDALASGHRWNWVAHP